MFLMKFWWSDEALFGSPSRVHKACKSFWRGWIDVGNVWRCDEENWRRPRKFDGGKIDFVGCAENSKKKFWIKFCRASNVLQKSKQNWLRNGPCLFICMGVFFFLLRYLSSFSFQSLAWVIACRCHIDQAIHPEKNLKSLSVGRSQVSV